MRLALILSDFAERMQALQHNLCGDFSVIVGRSIQESMDLLQTLPVDLALIDLDSDGARGEDLPERIRAFRPHCAVVAVLPPDGEGEGAGLSYDAALRADSSPYEITAVLARLMERQRLLDEIEQQRAEIRRLQARSERLQAARPPVQPVDKIIKAFSRALSSGFEQDRLLDLFVDTVLEMMRVSKVSVLLHAREPGQFRVRCYRGLRPDVAEGLRLRADSGLAAWLAREGRIMTRELAETSGISPDLRKEMDALQARVSIPMLCSGMLVGVLNLNNRVTGSAFTDDDLETLFTLAGHVAAAVRDTGVVRQMQHQKTYIEQILAHMHNGVITIDDRDQVMTYNQRAAEILGRSPEEVLQRDLRRLPSPLGDILYEVRSTGRRYQDEEVTIPPARLPLRVNAYRLQASDGRVLGSVAIIEDLRPGKEREKQRELTERLDLMGQLMGRLAAELKEPLTRIQQFVDQWVETWEQGPDPREAEESLRRELRRWERLQENLSLLAGGVSYHFAVQEVSDLIARGLRQARAAGLPEGASVLTSAPEGESAGVRADAEYLPRALSALIRYAAGQVVTDRPVEVAARGRGGENGGSTPGIEIRVRYRGRTTPTDVERLLDPLAVLGGEAGEGVDLSLPASRRIIEAHGGVLTAGVAEKDVFFSICLPIAGGQAGAGIGLTERQPLPAN